MTSVITKKTVCGAQCEYVCVATIGLNGNCNVEEIRKIFKTPTTDKQNIQETQNFLQSLMQECAKTEQVDEAPKDKKKTSGGKRKRSSTVDTKSPKRAKKTEDTERECEQNSFEIIGNKTEKF